MSQKLGEILKNLDFLDDQGLQVALNRKTHMGGRVGEHLVAMGALREEDLLVGLGRQLQIPFADNEVLEAIDKSLRMMVPRSKALYYRIVPIQLTDQHLILATCESDTLGRVGELTTALGHSVRLVLAEKSAVESTLSRLYATLPANFASHHIQEDPSAITDVFQNSEPLLGERNFAYRSSGCAHAEEDCDTWITSFHAPTEHRELVGDEHTQAETKIANRLGGNYREPPPEHRSQQAPRSNQMSSGPADTSHADSPCRNQGPPTKTTLCTQTGTTVSKEKIWRDPNGANPSEGEVFGHYLLKRMIKSGGMAEVHEASSIGFEGVSRSVAIKRILPSYQQNDDYIAMFIAEAKLTVQLNHSAIGQVYELGKVGDNHYIAMEYIDGPDANDLFSQALVNNRPLPISVAVYIVQKVLEGLDYAHRKCDLAGNNLGIIHRDVSPANVLCSDEGLVKIIDFGIAKTENQSSKTQPGLIKGKVSYMSPEQISGRTIDRRSDIFSTAIVLYELLAGQRLFAGDTEVETIRNVMRGDVLPIRSLRPSVPEDLAAIVHRALQPDPQNRPRWALDMSRDLERFLLQSGYLTPRSDLVRHIRDNFSPT